MTILFCYAVILTIACTTAFLAGSVLWHHAVAIDVFDSEEDAGEDIPDDPDRARDRQLADEMGVL